MGYTKYGVTKIVNNGVRRTQKVVVKYISQCSPVATDNRRLAIMVLRKDADIDIETIEPGLFVSEKAVSEGMVPLSIHQTTTSIAQEVTIRQVAPLVMVLTGATFLHVSIIHQKHQGNMLMQCRQSQLRQLSSRFPPYLVISIFQRQDSNG